VLLAGTVLVAVACRIPGAGDRLTGDEGYSWIVGSAPTAAAFLDRLARYENTPPLFYLLLTPVRLDDEVWIRWPSIAAGVAAMPVLYAAVRALLGTRAGLLAALGLAVSPLASAFSDYARGFALSTLGQVIALWACARLSTAGRRRWWWVYAGGAALAVWSEYNAILFLVCMLGAMLGLRARPWWETVVLGLAPMAALAPWLHQLQRGLDYDKVTKIAPLFPRRRPAWCATSASRCSSGNTAPRVRGGADPAARGDRGAARMGHAARPSPLARAHRGLAAGRHVGRRPAAACRAAAGGHRNFRAAVPDRTDPALRGSPGRRGRLAALARRGAGRRGRPGRRRGGHYDPSSPAGSWSRTTGGPSRPPAA
jgi:hypothetical protein